MNTWAQHGHREDAPSQRRRAREEGQSRPPEKNDRAECSHESTALARRGGTQQSALDTAGGMPVLPMARAAYKDILLHIAARPAESGGILLGPIGSNTVTRFYFDQAGSCTSASYSPDHVGLSQRMKQEWLPAGLDMHGFVHSHPGRLDWLTVGDLRYIRRLLLTNDDMDVFVAPIVIPIEFRMRSIIVLRTDMSTAREARLMLY